MKMSLRIRAARQRAKLSQEQLALELGVTRGAVANWECVDGVLPASFRLEKLAQVTGVAYEWLATGRGQMQLASSRGKLASADREMEHTPEERHLLQAFRLLPDHDRRKIIGLIEARLPHKTSQKR